MIANANGNPLIGNNVFKVKMKTNWGSNFHKAKVVERTADGIGDNLFYLSDNLQEERNEC